MRGAAQHTRFAADARPVPRPSLTPIGYPSEATPPAGGGRGRGEAEWVGGCHVTLGAVPAAVGYAGIRKR